MLFGLILINESMRTVLGIGCLWWISNLRVLTFFEHWDERTCSISRMDLIRPFLAIFIVLWKTASSHRFSLMVCSASLPVSD